MLNKKIFSILAGIMGFSLGFSGPAAAQNIADGKDTSITVLHAGNIQTPTTARCSPPV